ncbi:hypothetical protein [Allofranklinella schreckenbergeri]|uniref:hypothetical protein n=1 Tax=Allofranklinella schreckenbergeri TaxID=1076744 RepID=UPI0023B0F2C6|nr:hypothetical protein [Allofranklinella schreckenbergeri]
MQTGNKRGRPSRPAAQIVEVPADGQLQQARALVDMSDQMAQLQAGYAEGRDLLNQLLGQSDMAEAFEKFSRTVRISRLAYIKENKIYQKLRGIRTPHGAEFSGTWEGFCKLIRKSVDQVDRDIANLKAFGEEALESMSRMGIGYRELRQYRRLPEDQKQALIEVAKAGDKEGFVDLAEELIAKHAKEKEALAAQVKSAQAQVADARATLEAKDRVMKSNSAQINELAEKLEKLERGQYTPPPGSAARSADEQALVNALDKGSAGVFLRLAELELAAQAALESGSEYVQLRGRQVLEFLAQQLADALERLGVEVDFAERVMPDWLDPEALAVLERRNAEAGA